MNGTEQAIITRAHHGGRWRDAGEHPVFPVHDPATLDVIAEVDDVPAGAVGAIVDAAHDGFLGWRAVAPRRRADALHRLAELLVRRELPLATLISREMGKPHAEAVGEVHYAAGYVRQYAEQATRFFGRTALSEDGRTALATHPEPVGVAVLVTPWNFPLAMGARKVAPALAAGCSVIVKPSEETPLTMLAFAQLAIEAGVPPQAVSVVPTSDSPAVVAALIAHPRTAKLSFTGSTAVGRQLAAAGGERLIRMSMELGGNAPFVVCDDADLDAAVAGALIAKFRNGGQACTAANRFIVAERVAEEFTARLGAAAAALRPGHGLTPGTALGPMVNVRAAERIQGLVDDAVAAGASIAGQGERGDGPAFVPATVVTGVRAGMRIAEEEIFGPVAPVLTFEDDEEALVLANATPYGLASYVFAGDARRLDRFVHGLQAGMVGAGTGVVSDPAAPFGGIGASGFGREGGPEGLLEYLQLRYVARPLPA